MSVTYVGGVDPGLVHTGVVGFAFNPHTKSLLIKHVVVEGRDAQGKPRPPEDVAAETRRWFNLQLHLPEAVFIEKYQPRSHFGGDARLIQMVAAQKQALVGSEVLLNTGVKKIVRKHLMELLGVWSFSTTTHHQDLRSAARIAIYGMLKDDMLNRLISDIVRDHIQGDSWDVSHG